MAKKATKKRQKYINEWKKQHRDRVIFEVEKGEKEVIQAAAERAGKSTGQFIRDAIAYYRQTLGI